MNPHSLIGKGIWIWKTTNCENGDLDAIVRRATSAGFTHLILKIADGDDPYQIWDRRDTALELIPRLHAAGITVWGWNYIYGDPPARDAGKPRYWELEAQGNVKRIQQLIPLGLQGFVIDAEREYETILDRHTKAAGYVKIMRDALPDFPLALASWKFPSTHRGFAWQAFRSQIDLDMPQVYWIGSHNSVTQLERAYTEFTALAPQLPFIPAGPTFFEHDWRPTVQDLTDFLTQCVTRKLPAANFWTWDHLGLRGDEKYNPAKLNFTAEWDAIANFPWPGATAPVSRSESETRPSAATISSAPAGTPVPQTLPTLTGDLFNQLTTALNSRNPDLIVSLYNPTAGHVTAQSTVIGLPAIRAFYVGLLALMPDARFTLTPTLTPDNLRTFNWTATSANGAVTDGRDLLGLLDGKIQYHYTAYTFRAR